MTLAETLAGELGADSLDTGAVNLSRAAIDSVLPRMIVAPANAEEVVRAVASVEQAEASLIPIGNATHAHIGNPPRRLDAVLTTRRMNRILEHDAADMTVTVEAGVTLEQLGAELGHSGQWLPLDPPLMSQVTIGGLLAADLNGSLRFSHGKVRDYVLGLRAVIGGGTLVRGGGRVVKNVAGYDLPKLLIGSFGSLGVIVEATLKVRPRPAADVWLAAAAPSTIAAAESALGLLDAALAPYAVDLCNAGAASRIGLAAKPHVLVRLGGELAEVRDQRERLAPLLPGLDEITIGAGLRHLALGGDLSCRASVLPSDVPALLTAIEAEAPRFGIEPEALAHVGSGIVRLWAPEAASTLPFLQWLRFFARQRGGHLLVERLAAMAKRELDVWGEPSAPLELMRRVKQTLDPRGTFSPGRFVGGL